MPLRVLASGPKPCGGNYLIAFLALLTMNEFPNLFVFTGGMANLLCLLSSYEIGTKNGRRLVILLRGSLTTSQWSTWHNRSYDQPAQKASTPLMSRSSVFHTC